MVNHRLAAYMTFTEHDLYAPVRFARGHVWLDRNRHRNRIGEIKAVKLRPRCLKSDYDTNGGCAARSAQCGG